MPNRASQKRQQGRCWPRAGKLRLGPAHGSPASGQNQRAWHLGPLALWGPSLAEGSRAPRDGHQPVTFLGLLLLAKPRLCTAGMWP